MSVLFTFTTCDLQVGSSVCNLHGMNPAKMTRRGEEPGEMGGYFIVNGNEKIIRLLIQQRRHYVMGMVRGAYARRGPTFTGAPTRLPRLPRIPRQRAAAA